MHVALVGQDSDPEKNFSHFRSQLLLGFFMPTGLLDFHFWALKRGFPQSSSAGRVSPVVRTGCNYS